MSVAPGTRLGPYEIVGKLGEGGMGEVYRATDTRLGRDVAVKVLPGHATLSPDAEARFEREARAIAALNHPNICTLFDVGADEGRTFLVMELLDGETLHHVLSRGPMAIPAVVDRAIALADALDAAHGRGIIHRDIKPANVLVTTRGVMKLLDFGLARAPAVVEDATRSVDAALTGPGTAIGTLSYMSPEQLRAEAVDGRSDVFSLGLVVYEMLTGQRAFGGRTSAQVSAAILHDEPPSPITLRSEIPAKLDEIVLKALEKDPGLRYQSAAELRADLKRFKRQFDSAAPTSPPARSTVAPPSSPVIPAPSSSDAALAAGLVKRHPLAIGAAVLVALAAVGALWWTGARDRAPAAAATPELDIKPLTIDGRAGHATVSPDGKFIAYVRREDTRSSVVVKQLGSNSDVVIMPPSDDVTYWAPSVTPDGNYVDVLVQPATPPMSIVRVPFLGGAPRTIVAEADSGLGWSPDGTRMAYVRYDRVAQSTSLMVADASGQAARAVATRTSPSFYGMIRFMSAPAARPSWSADGRRVLVIGVNVSPDVEERSELVEVEVAAGTEHVLRKPPGFYHEGVYLDADRVVASGLTDGFEGGPWWLFPRVGEPVQLTDSLTQLSGVRLTTDRSSGVATREIRRSSIWTGTVTNGRFEEVVPESVAAPRAAKLDDDGRLFFSMRLPGSFAIFRQDRGRAPVQLLGDTRNLVSVAPDGRSVVALTGGGDVMRFNSDGSEARKLMTDASANPIAFTPDGSALLFSSNRSANQEPWLLPLSGGEPRRLAQKYLSAGECWLSMDGRRVIFATRGGSEVCAFPGFDDCRTLDVVPGPFSADGRFVYAVARKDPKNIVAQPIAGGAPVPVTRFTDKRVLDFSLSPDHRVMAITRIVVEADVVQVTIKRRQ